MKEGHKLAAYGLWLVTEENNVLYEDVFDGLGAPRGGGRIRPDTVQSLREASNVLVVGWLVRWLVSSV